MARTAAPGAVAEVVASLKDLHAAAAPLSRSEVLRGLSLEIRRGEQLALIGSSGAGKTSLLQVLACAVAPLSGALSLFGSDPQALSSSERQR